MILPVAASRPIFLVAIFASIVFKRPGEDPLIPEHPAKCVILIFRTTRLDQRLYYILPTHDP